MKYNSDNERNSVIYPKFHCLNSYVTLLMVGVLASPGKTISGVNVYIVCIKLFRIIVYESKYL